MWEEQLMPMKAAEVMGMLQWEEDSEIGSSDTKFVPQTMYQTHYDKPSDYSSLNERAPIDPCLNAWPIRSSTVSRCCFVSRSVSLWSQA